MQKNISILNYIYFNMAHSWKVLHVINASSSNKHLKSIDYEFIGLRTYIFKTL